MPSRSFKIKVGWKSAALLLSPVVGVLAYYATEGHLGYTFILAILTLGIVSQSLEVSNG